MFLKLCKNQNFWKLIILKSQKYCLHLERKKKKGYVKNITKYNRVPCCIHQRVRQTLFADGQSGI
jgi:hypothetical protein